MYIYIYKYLSTKYPYVKYTHLVISRISYVVLIANVFFSLQQWNDACRTPQHVNRLWVCCCNASGSYMEMAGIFCEGPRTHKNGRCIAMLDHQMVQVSYSNTFKHSTGAEQLGTMGLSNRFASSLYNCLTGNYGFSVLDL